MSVATSPSLGPAAGSTCCTATPPCQAGKRAGGRPTGCVRRKAQRLHNEPSHSRSSGFLHRSQRAGVPSQIVSGAFHARNSATLGGRVRSSALAGQRSWQAAHPTHRSGQKRRDRKFSSLVRSRAPVGQARAHSPQPLHRSPTVSEANPTSASEASLTSPSRSSSLRRAITRRARSALTAPPEALGEAGADLEPSSRRDCGERSRSRLERGRRAASQVVSGSGAPDARGASSKHSWG